MDRYPRKVNALSMLQARVSGRYRPLEARLVSGYNQSRSWQNRQLLCNAPFSGLYFSAEGNVLTCCFNRKHVLGNYPSQTPLEIWNGNPLAALRSAMRHNHLGMGCGICETVIREGNFSAVGARVYDDVLSKLPMPSMLEFELENTCNLDCIMCSPRFSSTAANKLNQFTSPASPYGKEFCEQLKPFIPTLTLTKFLGGEPFLIKIYYEIWDLIIRENPACLIFIQTNGTVMNERIRELFQYPGYRIGISLESLDERNWEAIRRGGNFGRMMQNLDFFRQHAERNNYHIGASVCFMKQNWKEIPEMIRQFNHWNMLVNFNIVWNPSQCALWNKSSSELEEIESCYRAISLPYETSLEKSNRDAFEGILRQIGAWKNEALRAEKNILPEKQKAASENLNSDIYLEQLLIRIRAEVMRPDNQTETAGSMLFQQISEKLKRVLARVPDDFPVGRAIKDACENAYEKEIIFNCGVMNDDELLADLLSKYSHTAAGGACQREFKKFPGD